MFLIYSLFYVKSTLNLLSVLSVLSVGCVSSPEYKWDLGCVHSLGCGAIS